MLFRSRHINLWIYIFIFLGVLNTALMLSSINKWYCFLYAIAATLYVYLSKYGLKVKRLQNFEFTDVAVEFKGNRKPTPYILLKNMNDKESEKFSIITMEDMSVEMMQLYFAQSYRLRMNQELTLTKEELAKLLREEGFFEV